MVYPRVTLLSVSSVSSSVSRTDSRCTGEYSNGVAEPGPSEYSSHMSVITASK